MPVRDSVHASRYVYSICNFGRLKFLQIPIWDICNLAPLAISWRNHKFRTRIHHPNILYRLQIRKAWTSKVNPRFLIHRSD